MADWELPDVDGVGLIRLIEGFNPMIRRLMFSGYTSVFNARGYPDIGVDAYLTKPMGPEKILEVVRSQLAESKMALRDRVDRTGGLGFIRLGGT